MAVHLTTADLRRLLSEPKIYPDLPERLSDDTPIALDSLGLIWLLHLLEEEYGLHVEPDDADLDEFTTVGRTLAYLNGKAAHAT